MSTSIYADNYDPVMLLRLQVSQLIRFWNTEIDRLGEDTPTGERLGELVDCLQDALDDTEED